MANIPSHMRLQSELIARHRAPRTSNAMLISLGSAIGLVTAVGVLLGGLMH